MPKILITGNGFDLSLGLPTSYNDFIKILNYVEKFERIDFELVYSLSSNSKILLQNYKSFYFDEEKIKLLKDELLANIWYQFFKNEFQIETWIDFENKIEYVLKIIYSSVKYLKTKVFAKGSLFKDNLYYGPNLFDNNIEIIQVLNSFNFIEEFDDRQNFWLNKEYLIEKYDYYIDIDLERFANYLYFELNHFKKIFSLYIENFILPLYDSKNFELDESFFSKIDKHYTFNYTPTFDFFFNKTNITSFLHGRVDSKSNKIVLGINEIPNEEFNRKFFIPFTKYFQKLDNKTDYDFINEFIDSKVNFKFFFYGHSLDESDKDYINEVFDFINNLNSTKTRIVVIYHNEESRSKLIINLLHIRGKENIQTMMKNKHLVFVKSYSVELKKELKEEISLPPHIRLG